MSIIGEMLFYNRNGSSVSDYARHFQSKLPEAVAKVPQADFDRKSDDEIVELVAAEMSMQPLEVDLAGAQKDVQETTLSVRDQYGFSDGPVAVPALRATKSMPFKGDAGLWKVSTGSWSTNMPRGEVRGSKLVVGIVVRTERAADAKEHIDSTIQQIQHYVAQLQVQIDIYNDSLPGQIRPLVEERRSRRGAASALLDDL
jgi:trehalose-6-phosphate synthase